MLSSDNDLSGSVPADERTATVLHVAFGASHPAVRRIDSSALELCSGTTDSAQGSGYVLMSPAGKVLADLKTTGNVSLDAYLGQQVGVQGTRFSEQEKRDVIEVSALEQVQLRQ